MEEFAVGYSHLFSSGVQRNDRHSIEGYGSGLIHAYRLKGTERFDSVEVANEHVVFPHSSYAERKCCCCNRRKSFRNSSDSEGN